MKKRVIGVIVLSIFLLYVSVSIFSIRTSTQNIFTSFLSDVNIVIYKIVTAPLDFSRNKIKNFKKYDKLLADNQKMESKMHEYSIIEAQNKALNEEINNLKKELDINKTLIDYNVINATVVFRNVGNWNELITIDKGKNHQINIGDAVVNSNGLIGKVVEVSTLSATIELLVNSNLKSGVSTIVNLEDKTLHAYINYYNKETGFLEMTFTDEIQDPNILKDKLVVTSGLGGVYPKGIEIGIIKSISKGSNNLEIIANVIPHADNDNLNYVGILVKK